MGYHRALKAINLEHTSLIPTYRRGTDLALCRPEFVQKLTGIDPRVDPTQAFLELHRVLDIDLIWGLGYGIPEKVEILDRTVYYGYTQPSMDQDPSRLITLGGFHIVREGCKMARVPMGILTTDFVVERPFKTLDGLLEYLDDYDPYATETRSVEEISKEYELTHKEAQDTLGDLTLITGGWYFTLFMYFFTKFGLLLTVRLAYQRPKEFERLLDRFADLSRKNLEAWSRTDIKAMVCHDDLADSKGPIMPPRWFRKHIISRYPKVWEPIKKRGLKVIFLSDGNYSPLIDDLAAAGVDGFILDEIGFQEFKNIIEKYGDSKVIIKGINRKTLRGANEKQIRTEVKQLVTVGSQYPGFFLLYDDPAGGQDIPIHNSHVYQQAIKKYRRRYEET